MFIPTKNNVVTVTDLRTRTIDLLDEVEKEGARYVFQRSSPKAVLLSMARYEEMVEITENVEALDSESFKAKIKKARNEKTYSVGELKKMLDL